MTAKVFVIFNQKGGCAKTMSTMQLAGTFGMRGLKVFVIDMDGQNTSSIWHLQASPDAPFPADLLSMAPLKEGFVNKLQAIAEKYDLIIIDCPPAIESRVPWAALMVADFAIIPVIPVMDNVWASKQAEELVFQASEARVAQGDTPVEAAYLLSVVRRGNVFDSCLQVLKQQAKLPILKAEVKMRNIYPESQLYGCVARSFGKSPASREIDKVAEEIADITNLKLNKA